MLMMLRLISSTVLTLLAAHVLAQAPSSQPRSIDTLGLSSGLVWAESITADELRGYAFALASDSMQGRETGTDGQRLAGRYLAREFSSFGLPRVGFDYSYMQPIAFESASWDRVRMSIDGKDSKHLKDFFAFPAESNTLVQSFDEVVYIGWGIDTEAYSDYREAPDLEGLRRGLAPGGRIIRRDQGEFVSFCDELPRKRLDRCRYARDTSEVDVGDHQDAHDDGLAGCRQIGESYLQSITKPIQ